jgi:heterodisulfide reductase subunit C
MAEGAGSTHSSNVKEEMELDHIAEEFDQCIKCGLCAATCPVCKELLIEKYSPRGKVQLARFYGRGDLELSDHFREIFAGASCAARARSPAPAAWTSERYFWPCVRRSQGHAACTPP